MRAESRHARRRTRSAFGIGALAVGIVLGPSAAPTATAEQHPAKPIWSDEDDTIAISQSRPQGPVIRGEDAGNARITPMAATSGDPVRGSFGPQVAWPIVPIHAIVLPDGRVMSYGTDEQGIQTAYYDYDVWDPRAGTGTNAHVVLPNGTATDIFCSVQVLLLNGDVEMYGGDNLPAATNTFNRSVTQFRPASQTLVKTNTMNRERWYATATVLPNAEVFVQGGSGGSDYPERRTSSGQMQLLTGAYTGYLSDYYPKNFVAPDGLVFGLANYDMYRINPAGNGSIQMLGRFPTSNVGNTSTSVMFRPGRILQVGGGGTGTATRQASVIDINGASPTVTAVPQLQYARHWANATVMADGRVFVSGGSSEVNKATGVAYTSEIFDPTTNTWSLGATAKRMRLYHSTSLLLPDASVITMGGGTPGPETNLNAEIYYPSYLFDANGFAAVRPTITTATTSALPGTALSINTPDAAAITKVSLVKLGSVTHSVDMDQRFLNLPFTRNGSTLQANLPANVYETPPGYYMIFVLNAAGVPSEAKIVKINVAGTTPPPAGQNLIRNGSFENNAVTYGNIGYPNPFDGWTNGGRAIEVWRNYNGYAAADGASAVELDNAGFGNRLDQSVATQAGQQYTLSFANSPRPGFSAASNSFDVYWNATKLGTIARDGAGLGNLSWQTSTFTVTGSGNDTLSFRENDGDNEGGIIDDVRLVATAQPPATTTTVPATTTTVASTTTVPATTTTVPPTGNLVRNGGFENNTVPSGQLGLVKPLEGWTNGTKTIEVWRNYLGYAAAEGASVVELDNAGSGNRLDQTLATQAGQQYTLSFDQSPRPGYSSANNSFTVRWNGTTLGTITRNGSGISSPAWQKSTFTVTGSGNDTLSFRENDTGSEGALIDNVRVIAVGLPPAPTTTVAAPTTAPAAATTTVSPTTTTTVAATTTTVAPNGNLIRNGSFENNPVSAANLGQVRPLEGWTNGTGAIEVWRNYLGYTTPYGSSMVEIDNAGAGNRVDQSVVTQAGRQYALWFIQSPRPGYSAASNSFDVYWNGTKVATIARDGRTLSAPVWMNSEFRVTGTGYDTLSFRENDTDSEGALIDNVVLQGL